MLPGQDGHTHYVSQIFFMTGVYGIVYLLSKRLAKVEAEGKLIEGEIIKKGENKSPSKFRYALTYVYGDGQQKKGVFRYKKELDKYQIGQKVTLIHAKDPFYLWGKQADFVAIKSSYDNSRIFFQRFLKYAPVICILIVFCEYMLIGVY